MKVHIDWFTPLAEGGWRISKSHRSCNGLPIYFRQRSGDKQILEALPGRGWLLLTPSVTFWGDLLPMLELADNVRNALYACSEAGRRLSPRGIQPSDSLPEQATSTVDIKSTFFGWGKCDRCGSKILWHVNYRHQPFCYDCC